MKPVATGASYDVFAVYEGVVIGKLRVVSYAKQQHKVTLVPINEVRLDKTAIEQELNAIYNPVGVQFTVNVDERMRDNYSWEVESEKDGLLSMVSKSFWGYDKELKESTEMLNLQKSYQQAVGTLDGAYLFVLNGATGLEGQKGGLLGEMPRKSRFGYIFAGNSPNTNSLVRTIAHELGHGIFTLQHTFDAEYGKGTIKETNNLLDYKNGTDLAAFQWNVMANPAVFTEADKAEEGEIRLKEGEFLGFTPDGRVIQARPKEYAGIFDNESSYFIYKFKDKNGSFYTWTGKNYTNDKGETFEVPDTPVTGKVAIWRNSSNPQCYVWYKFLDVHNYTSAQFEQIKQRIAKDDGSQWELDLVEGANASPACKDAAKAENEKLTSLQSFIHFTEHANISRFQILSELAKVFQTNRKNTLTENKEFDKDRVIIISIEGYDDNEIKELKSKYKKYLHFIFSNENGTIKFSRIESPDKFGDKLSHICELIKNEPWATQAIILYEVADLLDKGIEYLKIPESVWSCNNESNVYKKAISYLLDTQFPVLIGNDFIANKLNEDSKFAFVCGLWNGTVDIVQSVPQLVKLLNCALHADCRESASSQWESFKNAVIEDESGHILCPQEEYFCKARQMISIALNELVADNCKVAHTVGSVVGPIAVMCAGDVAAGEAVITRLGKVSTSLKYAIKGLQLCDKITDITRPLAKSLKVTTVLVKKAGKLMPEVRFGNIPFIRFVDNGIFKIGSKASKSVSPEQIENISEKEWRKLINEEFSNTSTVENAAFIDINEIQGQARKIAIAKYGKDAEQLIYVKFKENSGAAAEIIAHFGQEGLDALKKVNNIEDAANELIKGKIAYRHIGSDVNYLED